MLGRFRNRFSFFFAFFVCLVLCVWSFPASRGECGDVESVPYLAVISDDEVLETRKEAISRELATVRDADLHAALTRLRYLYDLLADEKNSLQSLAANEKRLAETKARLVEGRSLTTPPPYSYYFFGEVGDEYKNARVELDALAFNRSGIERARGDQRRKISEAESRLKALHADPDASPEELRLASVILECARVELPIANANIYFFDKLLAINKERLEILRQNYLWVRKNLAGDENEFREFERQTRADLYRISQMITTLQREFDDTGSRLRSAGSAERQVLEEKSNALGTMLSLLRRKAMAIRGMHEMLRQLYRMLTGQMSSFEMLRLREEVRNDDEKMKLYFALMVRRRDEIPFVAEDLHGPGVPSVRREPVDILRRDIPADERLYAVYSDLIDTISDYEDACTDVLTEIDYTMTPVRYARAAWEYVTDRTLLLWNAKVWSAESASASVGEVLEALFIFVVCIVAAWYLLRRLRLMLIGRFRVERTKALMLHRLLFALFGLLVALAALDAVNVPVAAFAFAGGALALGFGLGAQKLIHDLVSGFILIVGRSIRIGDMISLGDAEAKVEYIGVARTRVRTLDGVDILLPNGQLVNEKLVNYSYRDNFYQIGVVVPVALDADPERVTELLLQAAKDHPDVLRTPPPVVRFSKWTDSFLEFALYAWVDLSKSAFTKVRSDVRYRVNALLRENEIPMPRTRILLEEDDDAPR